MKRLRGWDAVLLYSETPNVHMHTLKLAVIKLDDLGGATFGVEELRKVIHSRLYKLDPFRYELIDIPFKFHHPMWRENAEVDLEYHVRSVRADAPGGRRQLDEAVGRIASTPLDRSRPLWEMYLIEGLAEGRIAVLGKIHHALADGVASANLLARGMDLSEGPQADRDSYATDPAPSKGELVRTAFTDHLRQIGRLPSVVRYTAQGVGRVRRSPHKLSPELTRPFTPPPSFMNHMVDATRKFATTTLSLDEVKQTGKQLGATINDMVLAMSAGALRQLLLRYDGRADHALLASVPVSFDFSRDRISGNYFTGVLVSLPVDDRGPSATSQGGPRRCRRGQGEQRADRPRTRKPMVGVLPAGPFRGDVQVAVEQGRPEQGDEPADLQCARSSRTCPCRWRFGDRDLLGRSVDGGQWAQHHGLELRRPAQHFGAVRW